MKKFFQFVLFIAILGGIAYVLKNILAPAEDEFAGSGSGVLPQEPIKSLDEAPLGGEISPELLKILVCPEDKGALELVDDGKFLLNPRNGYRYPIRNGIPVMLIEEGKKHAVASTSANGKPSAMTNGVTGTEKKAA
ncbi:MAG: Trm112 family protein [Caldilineaceae bacterium]